LDRPRKALVDSKIGDKIVRKADGGRRPWSIQEIPANRTMLNRYDGGRRPWSIQEIPVEEPSRF
jgi:hypothetical protein